MGLRYRVDHWGTQVDAIVMTGRAAELLALMPEKPPPDLSRFLLSPMPGLLSEIAVKPEQEVRAGETLVVIEAMKMQNILKAENELRRGRDSGQDWRQPGSRSADFEISLGAESSSQAGGFPAAA